MPAPASSTASSRPSVLPPPALEIPVQRLQTCLPECSVVIDPLPGLREGTGLEPAPGLPAAAPAAHQPCLFEDLDVLRDGRERHREGCGELAERQLPRGEARQDRPAGGVREGVEDVVELGDRTLNHLVDYREPESRLSTVWFSFQGLQRPRVTTMSSRHRGPDGAREGRKGDTTPCRPTLAAPFSEAWPPERAWRSPVPWPGSAPGSHPAPAPARAPWRRRARSRSPTSLPAPTRCRPSSTSSC